MSFIFRKMLKHLCSGLETLGANPVTGKLLAREAGDAALFNTSTGLRGKLWQASIHCSLTAKNNTFSGLFSYRTEKCYLTELVTYWVVWIGVLVVLSTWENKHPPQLRSSPSKEGTCGCFQSHVSRDSNESSKKICFVKCYFQWCLLVLPEEMLQSGFY